MIGKTTLIGFALVVAGALGCNQSKADLDKTRTDLQTVTAERDSLKTQLDQADTRATALQAQVTDLQTKLTAASAVAAAPAAADDKAEMKGGAGAKHGNKAKPAKEPTAATAPPPRPRRWSRCSNTRSPAAARDTFSLTYQ